MRIDNQEVSVTQEMSVLEAARQAGITIPTLCHLEALEPFGGCRLCIVEVEERGWSRLVVSCVFPADDKLIVRTRSEKIDRLRKTILEEFLRVTAVRGTTISPSFSYEGGSSSVS